MAFYYGNYHPNKSMNSYPYNREKVYRKDNIPCRKDDSPCRKDDTPCRKDDSPCRKDDTPCRKDDMPCRKDDTPCRKDDMPCRKDDTPCSCKMPLYKPLAIAYVPWQIFDELYDVKKSLCTGTVFPCLDKPFMAGGKCR